MKEKKNIRTLSQESIGSFFAENNDKPYRAKQVYEWIWQKAAQSFSQMTNLPINTRKLLDDSFYINNTTIKSFQKSIDGTIKVLFMLPDNNLVEGVLIPEKQRVTACISSQIGCAFKCSFCATGKLGFKRNLGVDEIFDEVVLLKKLSLEHYSVSLSNIVYMGMGEPLMNYENVIKSIDKITSDEGLAMSPKRITVSTVGIPEKIRKLADDNIKFNLAISIHSANEEKRSSIVPINKKYSLQELSQAIKYFHNKTKKRITYEYLMLKDINDYPADAQELAHFCKISPCKINLIEYNSTEKSEFRKADNYKTGLFAEFLKNCNLIVNIRRSKGKDINAACGQLCLK